ncbi:DUF3261 domain-containing protein [Chitinivorax tropicus]|nr:DUF3261 domain-containing protein [Chitinivorax tropicus]
MPAWVALLVAAGLSACSTPSKPPALLQLAPATLGQALSLQQRVTVDRDGQQHTLDAVLEVDHDQLTLVGMALGQRVLTLHHDGTQLHSHTHPLLPSQVQAADILSDLQLALWPAARIVEALPTGWRLDATPTTRTLFQGQQRVAEIHYTAQPPWLGRIELHNLRYEYQLTIESAMQEN